MYSIDSLVVYPAQGVGKIERIDRKEIGGASCDFYTVRIRANNITLMVPVTNAAAVGLRELSGRAKADAIWDSLRRDLDQPVFTGQNWNRRFREYTDRLKSPDLSVVADVLRELLLIGRGKDLSFGERRLLDQAMALVAGELSEILHISESALKDELLALYAPAAEEEKESA